MSHAFNLTRRNWAALGTQAFAVAVLAGVLPITSQAAGRERHQTAREVATLYRAARKVISDTQALINNANEGDKGLNGFKDF